MEFVADTFRMIHVAFGFLGLAAFWAPVFMKKGGKRHVQFGRVFVWSAYIVLGAAAISLTQRVVTMQIDGITYADKPGTYSFIAFLGYLTLVTYVGVRHGMKVLEGKTPDSIDTPLNRVLAYVSIAASVSVILFALIWSPPVKIVLLALSPIGFGIGFGNLRYMNGKVPSKRGWFYEHLGAMLGTGIAFHTAFAVFGLQQLFQINVTGWAALIPWAGPAAIGIPAIAIWTNYYRKKFGETA